MSDRCPLGYLFERQDQYLSTVSKQFKVSLEGQSYVHFEVILSRNVKIFGIMASL